MKRLIVLCVLLTLFAGCKESFVSWNGVKENEVVFSGFWGKDAVAVQMPKSGNVAIKTYMQQNKEINKLIIDVSYADKEKMMYYDLYLMDLPVKRVNDELTFSSRTSSATCVKAVMEVDVIQAEHYEGELKCSGTMKYSSETVLEGNWQIKILLDNNEKIVLNLDQLKVVNGIGVPVKPS